MMVGEVYKYVILTYLIDLQLVLQQSICFIITVETMISTGSKSVQAQVTVNQAVGLAFQGQQQSDMLAQSGALPLGLSEDRRRNEKNKFINKLKQLQQEGISDLRTIHKTHPCLSANSTPSNRRQRNKIAARESRDRKKLYVKLMETKINNVEMELMETVEEIEHLRLQIFNAEMHQGVQGKEAKHKQMHIIKKLEGLLAGQEIEERNNEINICLDSIIYRIGALGNERKAALKKLYSDLLNFSQPALYRYMLWSAVQKIHIFGDGPVEDDKWCKEIEQVADAVVHTAAEKGADLHKIGTRVADHCQNFQQSAQVLVKFRQEIQKKGQALDNVFNSIREMLSPQQVANLILFVERYQFKKEVRLFQEEAEKMSRPHKKIKTEMQSS